MKKLVPDQSKTPAHKRRSPELDQANKELLQKLALRPTGKPLAKSIKHTSGIPVGSNSLFAIREGITAEEALLHVSLLLKSAEEVSDEITERGSGIERGLIWSLVHSVEMARAVVDALLDGSRHRPSLK
ncbi:hypothetical protein GGD92_15815 [Pseudomonas protegens]|uniref:DUF3077 domain-containing protein n=1 Tax=Pseudomonas protegens TaxID=380021 RepID=A0A7G7XI43_9PSED|nr:hypothetical protein [Pseudomonas protegens]QNH79638.1 hypothetical protein GGI48_10890 [Pseudomonas protegens]QNL03065.1 hypothetical protein GGD92_15815 [Pseudomonas protegens]